MIFHINSITQVEYLMRKHFPQLTLLKKMRRGSDFATNETNENYIKNAEAYRSKLFSMSKEEFDKLYKAEVEKEYKSQKLKEELEEKGRFFNQPNTKADFEHWSKVAYWTLEEATALCFGKEPKKVFWEMIKTYYTVSPFVQKYEKVRDLALRAKAVGLLTNGTIPIAFIHWAKRNDIEMPSELEKLVMIRSENTLDWKGSYEILKKQRDAEVSLYQKQLGDMDSKLKGTNQEIDSLKAALEEKGKKKEKPLSTREKETLLKLIIGMAVDAYGYQPEAAKSPIATELGGHLARLGVSLDPDTIRNKLKEAAELLPQEVEDA